MFVNAKQSSAHPNVLELYFYTDIEDDYVDWFSWKKVESKTSGEYVRKALSEAGNIDEIILYINSYGGSVKEALGIYSQLRRHPAKVTAYVDGYAASAAAVILAAADHRIMGCNTVQMLHYPWATVSGNAAQLRSIADDLDVLGVASEQAFLERAGDKLDKKTLQELMNAERYIDAQRCLELGLCDEVSNKVVDMAAARDTALKGTNTQNKAVQRMLDIYEKQFGTLPQSVNPTPPNPVPEQKKEPETQPASVTETGEPQASGQPTVNMASAFLDSLEKIFN